MYLVDNDDFSELRRSRRNRDVVAWFGDVNAADLFLSVVTLGEIELGISRQQHLNPVFAQQLADWLDLTLRAYRERIFAPDYWDCPPMGSACSTAWQQTACSRNCRDRTRKRPHRGDTECIRF